MTADSNRTILIYVPDFIFRSRIVATAEQLGVAVQPAGTRAGFEAGLATAGALVIDLQAEGDDPLALVRHARTARPDLPILGFFPHVESALRKQAVAAGVDPVLPRSKFAAELPDLLRALATGNP